MCYFEVLIGALIAIDGSDAFVKAIITVQISTSPTSELFSDTWSNQHPIQRAACLRNEIDLCGYVTML
jgi:hypothetical protein